MGTFGSCCYLTVLPLPFFLLLQVNWENAQGIAMAKSIPIEEAEAKKLNFTFSAPEDVQILGSFLLHTVTKPVTNVDVGVELPKVKQNYNLS